MRHTHVLKAFGIFQHLLGILLAALSLLRLILLACGFLLLCQHFLLKLHQRRHRNPQCVSLFWAHLRWACLPGI